MTSFVTYNITDRVTSSRGCKVSFELTIHAGPVSFIGLDTKLEWNHEEYADLVESIKSNQMNPTFRLLTYMNEHHEVNLHYNPDGFAGSPGYMLLTGLGIKIFNPIGGLIYKELQQMFLTSLKE